MNSNRESFVQINKRIKLIGSFLIMMGVFIAFRPVTDFAQTPNQTVSRENKQDENFEKKIRVGRDLIDKGEWVKAADKFNEVISNHPGNKSVDVALYWLAYCYKRQKQFKEMDTVLNRLLKEFPASTWADDAKVMKIETLKEDSAKKLIDKIAIQPGASVLPNFPILPGLPNKTMSDDLYASSSQTSIDRETEIKIVAFKSLLSADPKRAVQIMGDILKPDSNAGETFKVAVLRGLRKPFFLEEVIAKTSSRGGPGNQLIVSLREILIRSLQKEPNIKIRSEIIYALVALNDDQSINYLAQLYASDSNQEIKKAIINSFGSIFVMASTNLSRKIQFDKLVEIARAEKDAELRRLVYSNLQFFENWETVNEKFADAFVQLYEAENNEQLKILIIRSLGDSKQSTADKKLLKIAKNDKSDKLKLEAIYALRTSNNPEVLKFLEELIK